LPPALAPLPDDLCPRGAVGERFESADTHPQNARTLVHDWRAKSGNSENYCPRCHKNTRPLPPRVHWYRLECFPPAGLVFQPGNLNTAQATKGEMARIFAPLKRQWLPYYTLHSFTTGSGQFQEPFLRLPEFFWRHWAFSPKLPGILPSVASSSAGFALLSVRPRRRLYSGCSHVAIAVRHDGKFREFLSPSRSSEQAGNFSKSWIAAKTSPSDLQPKCYSSCYSLIRVFGAFRVGCCRMASRAVSRDTAATI
jgi:hypothetical protein